MVPVLAGVICRRKHAVGKSWRMDETYIKVAGEWKYLYRASHTEIRTLSTVPLAQPCPQLSSFITWQFDHQVSDAILFGQTPLLRQNRPTKSMLT